MTTSISTAFVAQFDAEVKAVYQGTAQLVSAVRQKTGVIGSTYRFAKIGKGTATPRIPQADAVPMNLQHGNVTATLEDWSAAEYSSIQDLGKLNFDERTPIKMAVASAMGRRMDQLIIDALDVGANSNQVDISVGGANSGLNTAKLRRAKRFMDAAGVPKKDRFFASCATSLETLLGETAATSSDFNTVRALVNGEIDTWLGFKFLILEDRDEGGIEISTNTRKSFAFHKEAIGLAIGQNMKTDIDWIAEKKSWLIEGLFSAGAVGIDDKGIYGAPRSPNKLTAESAVLEVWT